MHRPLLALLLACLALPALAAPPSAIGRLTYGSEHDQGRAICTASLVAPDLILTAAHCVANTRTGKPMDPASLRFDAGYNLGQSIATRFGAEVILADPSPHGQTALAKDLALVRLAEPIPESLVPALRVALALTEPLSLITYRRDAPETASPLTLCPRKSTEPGLLYLDCSVVSGNSGAPVLSLVHGQWTLVAVVIARSSATSALAAVPPKTFRRLIATP